METFVAKNVECNFVLPQNFLDAYRWTDVAISLTSFPVSSFERNIEDGINLSSFRLSMVEEIYEYTTWHLDEGILDDVLVKKLFFDDFSRYTSFLNDQTEILNSLRAFFLAYRERVPSIITPIDECTVLQPIFQLFFTGLLNKLPNSALEVVAANKMKIFREIDGANGIKRLLFGHTDVMLFEKDNDCEVNKIPESSVGHIEVKAPFTYMFRSKAEAERDQLIGETDCITSMKVFKSATSSSSTTSTKVISTCGALTDMFAIVLVCQYNASRTFYTTEMEFDERVYIKYLLVLCLKNENEDIKKLIAAPSLGAIDPIPDGNAFSTLRKSRKKQVGVKQSKKRSAPSSANLPNHKKTDLCLNNDAEDEYQEKLDILFAYEGQLKNPSSLTEGNLLRWNKLY